MADTEIIAIAATTLGTTMGSAFTYLGLRRKTKTDDQATFRQDLMTEVRELRGRVDKERDDCDAKLEKMREDLAAEQRRCDEKLEAAKRELKDELDSKLKRQAASIRAEYRRDLEERSSGE